MTTQTLPSKVLVVDDDWRFLKNMKFWLQKEGYKAHTAELGKAGLQLHKLYKPYVAIVLDLQMPKVDGYQVLREIKKIDRDIKILVVTGDADSQKSVIGPGISPAADDFVLKPVGPKELCKRIRRLLGDDN